MRRQLHRASKAPPSLLLRFLDGFPVTRKCFSSFLIHPAVMPDGNCGHQSSLAPSETPLASMGLCGFYHDVLLLSLLALGLVPAGVFLHSTATRPFGVCWPGPQHRGEGLSLEPLLVGQPLCCGQSGEGFPGSPVIHILHLPVPSSWRWAPLNSIAMSQLWMYSKPGNISISQLTDKPAAVPFDVL